jgi:hypothetical protein
MVACTGCVAHIKQALEISSGDTSSISMTVPVSWICTTHPDLQVVRRIKQEVPRGGLSVAFLRMSDIIIMLSSWSFIGFSFCTRDSLSSMDTRLFFQPLCII